MIEIKDLVKDYNSFRALDNLSLSISENDIVGLLGPNGAGKTTLMRIITGFIPFSYGDIKIDGMDIFKYSMEVKRLIGYLPESCPIYTEMTVRDFLIFMAKLKGVEKNKLSSRLSYVAEAVNITHCLDSVIATLSKGYKQRVGLAQSLIHNPKLLILDEPTVGLDPVQIIEIRQLIQTLRKDRTIILSSHILSEVSQTCEKIIIIANGSIVAQGTESEIVQKFSGDSVINIQVKDSVQKASSFIRKINGVFDVKIFGDNIIKVNPKKGFDLREKIINILVSEKISLLEISTSNITLEQAFIQLTQEKKSVKNKSEVYI